MKRVLFSMALMLCAVMGANAGVLDDIFNKAAKNAAMAMDIPAQQLKEEGFTSGKMAMVNKEQAMEALNSIPDTVELGFKGEEEGMNICVWIEPEGEQYVGLAYVNGQGMYMLMLMRGEKSAFENMAK
ncbi:MAG: hypothetical protein K2M79_00455 [Muribaculaceae bacterium]|nr:hypothetical protein [Muribaculaceae bacterium]